MEQIAVSSLMEERMRWTREILKRHSRSGLVQYPDAQQPAQVTAQGCDHKAQQKHRRTGGFTLQRHAHPPYTGGKVDTKAYFHEPLEGCS